MLSEGEEGKAASYDERLQKLATVTGLPIDQVSFTNPTLFLDLQVRLIIC